MFKRCCALVLAFLTLLLSGCSLFPAEQAETIVIDPNKYVVDFQNEWYYNTLSAEEKTYYGYLYTSVKDAENQEAVVTISDELQGAQSRPGVEVTFPHATLSKERISALFEAFFRDNPQFFYLSRTYHLEGRRSTDDNLIYYDGLILEYTMPLKQRQSAITQVEQSLQSILAECPTSQDEYVRELYLHDQLTALCQYDEEAAKITTDADSLAYTAYGVYTQRSSYMRFGIDIKGGVSATFQSADEKIVPTDDQLESAREVIELRLDNNNIFDRTVTMDKENHCILVEFPWQATETEFDPVAAIAELGETAKLTFSLVEEATLQRSSVKKS